MVKILLDNVLRHFYVIHVVGIASHNITIRHAVNELNKWRTNYMSCKFVTRVKTQLY